MTPTDRILIERNRLLRGISQESFKLVLENCPILAVVGGNKLLDIGQKNDSLYLLLEGELHVFLDSNNLSKTITLEPGECVGELSLIDGQKTAALVIAAHDSRVLVMPYDLVWSLVDSSHEIARNLLGILAGRIRNDNLLQVTTLQNSLEFEIPDNVDVLTGLHNRRWMEDTFPRMLARCERGNLPLCMLMTDIDGFSGVNGNHGRAGGDQVLRGVARIMAENLRPQDLLARLVGDKFIILLPETSTSVAMKIAERLRESVATATLLIPADDDALNRDTHITVSVGITAMQAGDKLASIITAAHGALSQSKASGRNRSTLLPARN